MIVGAGVDIVAVARLRAALSHPRTGERFKRRVFTPGEIAYCDGRQRSAMESYAARFTAKEAAMKALGKGFGDGLGWREIEVRRRSGAPELALAGRARRLAGERGVSRLHVSLAHTSELAIAYVIAEGGGANAGAQ